ncbi:MAG: hypothetical protein Q9160_006476 [Pyrenula sp. 1 TL-2023]
MADNAAQDKKQTTQQPVEDTQEAEKGGILPEGWTTEDKPNPDGKKLSPNEESVYTCMHIHTHIRACGRAFCCTTSPNPLASPISHLSPTPQPIFLSSILTLTPDAYLGKYGNKAGQSIQSTLGKVGEPLGTGLNYAARPVGGLVEPIVGGLMGSGKAFDGLVKEEYGKPNTEDVKAELAKGEGGEEQNAGNPLGLKGDAKEN